MAGNLSPSHHCALVALLNVFAALGQNDMDCKWRANVTDIQTVQQHKYVILEDCLYYFLSQAADKEYGKSSALILLPPTKGKPNLPVAVHRVVVRQMWMNEVWKEMHINGFLTLSWPDDRLKWNTKEWKLEKLKIKAYGHLWMPDIYSDRYQTSMQSNDFVVYQDIESSRAGNVSARLEYRMQALCSVDYSDYPSDKKKCCFQLKSYAFPDLLKFSVGNPDGILDAQTVQTNWDIRHMDLLVRTDSEDDSEFLQFCVLAGRKSSTLRIELTVPMVISAVLVLIAPLFGSLYHQLLLKLFAILLQFLCFQFLVTKTPQLGFGDAVPKIYKFYEFTLVITLVSLLITLVISAISRMERSLPPPHGCLLAASAVNAKLCCSEDPETDPIGNAASGTTYAKEWKQIFAAISNICSILIVLVYIIGVIVLCS